ncbi:neuromedin Bb [Eucyclogobius newberryi]|uniref:neuromedin Bb n=1 Tax=Eucyclogobius newberryi TaxID=166745 RepID=UPI003B59CDCA
MKGTTIHNVCHFVLFTYLVFVSFMPITAAVSFDLTELRNKVAKIKVNPRGNLWATGHFMGKKSVVDAPLLPSLQSQSMDALDVSVPAEQSALAGIFQDFLQMALETQKTQESRSKNLESNLLMEVLQSYLQDRK